MATLSKPSTSTRSDDHHDKATLWAFYFLMGMLGVSVIILLLALITF